MDEIETFESFTGHHFLTKDKVEHPMDARVVMGEAGALFDVAYPPSGFYHGGIASFSYPRVKDGVNRDKPLHKYVVRTDTMDVLGLHSYKYAETEGYGFIADMAEELFPEKTTSCTVFGAGEKIAVTQELIAPIDLGGEDIIQPQICWVTSYNGVWATAVYDLTSRLFCQNQLIGQQPLVKVKHTKNHDILLEMRVRILEGSIARAETLVNMARVLKDQAFTDEQFNTLIGELLPYDANEMTERQVNNVLTRQQYCRGAWYKEKE